MQSQIVKENSHAGAHYSENVFSIWEERHEFISQRIVQFVINLHTINFFGRKRFHYIKFLRRMLFFHSIQLITLDKLPIFS